MLGFFQEELVHFENRIKKHEYVQEQLKLSELEMKEKHKDGVYSQKHKQLQETARTYEKRVNICNYLLLGYSNVKMF